MGIFNRKKKASSLQNKLSKQGKIMKKQDTSKVKGGKAKKKRIWNGCGGIIPQ